MVNLDKVVELVEKSGIDNFKKLLEKDRSILEEKDIWRWTILHYATERGNIDLVKLLLDYGMDVNARDSLNRSSLFVAIIYEKKELVKLLIDYKSEINIKDSDGWSPLHHAVKGDSVDIVKLLLEHGADPNTRNNYNQTPLHYAIEKSDTAIAKYLILHNANPYLKDSEGKTPLDFVENNRIKNELLFLYHNREKILDEMTRQRGRGVEYE